MAIETKLWAFDIEIFQNLFTFVARKIGTKEYKIFLLHDGYDFSEKYETKQDLLTWLQRERPILVGYNAIGFDAQLTQFLRENPFATANEIYIFTQELFARLKANRFDLPYSAWKLTDSYLDLYTINHYDGGAKSCSLKWLGFTMRKDDLSDLPTGPHSNVPKSSVTKVVSYNKKDVDHTYDFYFVNKKTIDQRYELSREYGAGRMVNMSDASLAEFLFKKFIATKNGITERDKLFKQKTTWDFIPVEEIIVPYVGFEGPEFNEILDQFKATVIDTKKGLKSAEYKKSVEFGGIEFEFGSGGLHACCEPRVAEATEDLRILSIDVESYYPNLSIHNDIYPAHLSTSFLEVYNDVFEMRKKHPKGSAINYMMKIILNSVYGKSNSDYSFLYDTKYTVSITVNGQLLLAMLAEQLGKIGSLLMVNTDGVELMLHKDKLEEANEICDQWEMVTGLNLERVDYKKMIIRDVNNYIAVTTDGKSKRKGSFELYEDITGENGGAHSLHKNPSENIVAKAVYEYFVNAIPPSETVYAANNIHDFCSAVKGSGSDLFMYWLIKCEDSLITDIDQKTGRVLRYYASESGSNLYKFWKIDKPNRARLTSVKKNQLVANANKLKKENIIEEDGTVNYDVNREYYIEEAHKRISDIEVSN